MIGKTAVAVLMTALLLVSAVGGMASVVAAGDNPPAAAAQDNGWGHNGTNSADSAYVTDRGDVILVYETNGTTRTIDSRETTVGDGYESRVTTAHGGHSSFENASAHAGVNVSAGLAHFLVTDDGVQTNTTGNLTLWAGPDEVAANGTLSTPKPDWLTNLDLGVRNKRNETVNRGSMDLDATMALEGETKGLSLLQHARTSGFVTTTPTSLRSNGSAGVEVPLSVWPDRHHHLVLTETDGSYTLSVDESYVLQGRYGADPTEGWDSRDAARRTLQQQYCSESSNVSCSISLDNYSLKDGDSPRLDLSYSVTYDGVDTQLSNAIVTGLTASRTNVSRAKATALADHVENVTLSRVEADLHVDGGDLGVSWNVSIDGRDDLTLAYADLLDVVEQAATANRGMAGTPELSTFGGPFGQSPGKLAETLRARTAASAAADLDQTARWNLSFATHSGTARLTGRYTRSTTNWADYVDELQSRDVDASSTSALALNASTVDDRVLVSGAARFRREGMVQDALESYNSTLPRTGSTENVTDAIAALEEANFTRARLDYRVSPENVTVEGAMAVENGSAITGLLGEPYDAVDGVYASSDAQRVVVYVNDAVESGADEAAVRDLALVGPDTEIHLSGEWDQSFGSLDTQYVRSYLGLTGEDGNANALPLIVIAGGGVAVTAAAGGGILLFRKWG